MITRLLVIGEKRDFAEVSPVIQITPDQLPGKGGGENRSGIIAIPWRDGLQPVSFGIWVITSFLNPAETSIPNDNVAARTSGRDQAINDGVNDIAMGREKLAPGRGNLDADLIVR